MSEYLLPAVHEVQGQGFRTVYGNDLQIVHTNQEATKMALDSEIGAVVVGMSTSFSYTQAAYAIRCVTCHISLY